MVVAVSKKVVQRQVRFFDRRWLLAAVLATAAGALCAWLQTPLPWMIGPLVMMAVCRFSGMDLAAPPGSRVLGQWIIATALGLYFTPTVAREVAAHWGVFVAAGLFALALAYLGAFMLWRFTDTDLTTAFLASVPGGATEMANLGDRFGGDVGRIALAQSLRILMVVIIVPVLITLVGARGSDAFEAVNAPVNLPMLALLMALGALAAWVFAALRSPNAWMFGPLVVTVALTANGVEWTAVPTILVNAAQVLIGCNLGQRFQREFLRSAPRFVAVVVVATIVILIASGAFAYALASWTGLAVASMVLATAPGGIAEMCITAKALKLGVPIVTAAHVARVVILVMLAGPAYRLTRRLASRRSGP